LIATVPTRFSNRPDIPASRSQILKVLWRDKLPQVVVSPSPITDKWSQNYNVRRTGAELLTTLSNCALSICRSLTRRDLRNSPLRHRSGKSSPSICRRGNRRMEVSKTRSRGGAAVVRGEFFRSEDQDATRKNKPRKKENAALADTADHRSNPPGSKKNLPPPFTARKGPERHLRVALWESARRKRGGILSASSVPK